MGRLPLQPARLNHFANRDLYEFFIDYLCLPDGRQSILILGIQMNGRAARHFAQSSDRIGGFSAKTENGPGLQFEVNVIYSTVESAPQALQMAGNLARDLGARPRFIVLRNVPYAFPLTQPPVSVAFTEERFAAIAENSGVKSEINLLICNCRDPRRAIAKLLKPHSLVVMGVEGPLRSIESSRLAAKLRAQGHEVILVKQSEGSRDGSFLLVHWRAVFRRLLGLHQGF